MRGLNIFRWCNSPESWENHQLSCIADSLRAIQRNKGTSDVTSIAPLIPGSYLFNQMLKIDQHQHVAQIDLQPSVTSVNAVYESLSFSVQWRPGSTIVVDINESDHWCMESLQKRVALLLDNSDEDKDIDTLIVLQPRQLTVLKKMFAAFPLRVQSLHPDWGNTAQMLAYYRSAAHVLFVNTSRAADAAFCSFPNTLICSQPFVDALKTDALWKLLAESPASELCCASPPARGFDLPIVPVIDNRIGDLQAVLSQKPVNRSDDWLAEYMVSAELNAPVIPAEFGWRNRMHKIIDTRISLRRKGQKLKEDPRQFCTDSKSPVLKALGRLLPARAAA